jgi:hypothetical protein
MEKENQKARTDARREYNDTIRASIFIAPMNLFAYDS